MAKSSIVQQRMHNFNRELLRLETEHRKLVQIFQRQLANIKNEGAHFLPHGFHSIPFTYEWDLQA